MIISRGEWNMTKNRIVKYVANTALLAVLAAAGIGCVSDWYLYAGKETSGRDSIGYGERFRRDIDGRCGCQSGGLRNF